MIKIKSLGCFFCGFTYLSKLIQPFSNPIPLVPDLEETVCITWPGKLTSFFLLHHSQGMWKKLTSKCT